MMSCYLTYFIVDLIETLNLEEARIGPLLGSGCKHIPMCNLPLLLIDNGGFMLMNSDFFETLLWALTIIDISCQVVYLLWLEGYGLPIGVGHNPKYTRCNDTRHDVVAMLVCSVVDHVHVAWCFHTEAHLQDLFLLGKNIVVETYGGCSI